MDTTQHDQSGSISSHREPSPEDVKAQIEAVADLDPVDAEGRIAELAAHLAKILDDGGGHG